jgi:hypothetical protein
MDSCGRDCDTNLRLFFSSASGLKRSRDRRRRWRGRRSGRGRSNRRRSGWSWWRGHRQLDDQPSPLLSSFVLQPPPLQSLLKPRDLRVLQWCTHPRRTFLAVDLEVVKSPGDAAIWGRCCKPSNPGRRDRSRSRWFCAIPPRRLASAAPSSAARSGRYNRWECAQDNLDARAPLPRTGRLARLPSPLCQAITWTRRRRR